MTQAQQDSYVPEFLQNSPYIPISTGNDDYSSSHHVRPPIPPPTFSQLLRSRPARQIIIALIVLFTFFYLRSQAREHHLTTHLGLAGPKCLLNDPVVVPELKEGGDVDWSQYAYVQYVTNPDYLCNSVLIFEALHRMGSKAGRLMMYPSTYSLDRHSKLEGNLLIKARDEYDVTLIPIDVLSKDLSYAQWSSSYTKLLAFNQTTHTRLLLLDSDATLLKSLDELFFVPPARAAMPRAYWLEKPMLASHIMVISPSAQEFSRVQKAISKASLGVYDMEIVNNLYGSDCVVLPHKNYALLSGEFRGWEHGKYTGGEDWDAGKVVEEVKYVHFSDDPFPKPWVEPTTKEINAAKPACDLVAGKVDCRGKEFWEWLYEDFRKKRKDICELDLEPVQ